MSDQKRTPEQIQEDLARTRVELADSVDELTTMLDPREQLKDAKANLRSAAEHGVKTARTRAQALLEDVKSGDPKALGVVGGVAAVAVLAVVARRRSGS